MQLNCFLLSNSLLFFNRLLNRTLTLYFLLHSLLFRHRKLVKLLDSDNDLTLEVACFDLGEFARFHPDGRLLLDKLHAKRKLMVQMSHPSAKVSKMALLAVQKLMVQNWESLGGGSSKSS